MYFISLVILVILYHCRITEMKKMENCKAVLAMCPHWFTPCIGEAPKVRRCEPPICCAVNLACVNEMPNKEA